MCNDVAIPRFFHLIEEHFQAHMDALRKSRLAKECTIAEYKQFMDKVTGTVTGMVCAVVAIPRFFHSFLHACIAPAVYSYSYYNKFKFPQELLFSEEDIDTVWECVNKLSRADWSWMLLTAQLILQGCDVSGCVKFKLDISIPGVSSQGQLPPGVKVEWEQYFTNELLEGPEPGTASNMEMTVESSSRLLQICFEFLDYARRKADKDRWELPGSVLKALKQAREDLVEFNRLSDFSGLMAQLNGDNGSHTEIATGILCGKSPEKPVVTIDIECKKLCQEVCFWKSYVNDSDTATATSPGWIIVYRNGDEDDSANVRYVLRALPDVKCLRASCDANKVGEFKAYIEDALANQYKPR
jgi:hypothetical protein